MWLCNHGAWYVSGVSAGTGSQFPAPHHPSRFQPGVFSWSPIALGSGCPECLLPSVHRLFFAASLKSFHRTSGWRKALCFSRSDRKVFVMSFSSLLNGNLLFCYRDFSVFIAWKYLQTDNNECFNFPVKNMIFFRPDEKTDRFVILLPGKGSPISDFFKKKDRQKFCRPKIKEGNVLHFYFLRWYMELWASDLIAKRQMYAVWSGEKTMAGALMPK